MKKLNKWLPHELTANQKKIVILKYCLLLFYTVAMNHRSTGLQHETKSGYYKTTGKAQLSGWIRRGSKALPKAKLAPKKGHGHCLMVCRLSDPPQLSESRWNHYIKNARELDEMQLKLQRLLPARVNRKGPVLLRGNTCLHSAQPKLQKLNELGYNVLPHLPYSTDLSPTGSNFFKHFDNCLQGKCFHSQQEAENAF